MKITEQRDPDRALAFGCPTLIGTLTSTGTTVNNATTAVPFYPAAGQTEPSLAGRAVLIQATAAGYVIPVTTSAGTASSTTAIYLSPNDPKTYRMSMEHGYLAWISVTGTASLVVFELN